MKLKLRDLETGDLKKGLVDLLGQLTSTGATDLVIQEACVQEILSQPDIYKVVVVEDLSRGNIVATPKLFIERKLTRSCGKCGHIEDVVVDQLCRGQKLGKRLLDSLIGYAREVGCYKVILDCSEENVAFYEKCGLTRKEPSPLPSVPQPAQPSQLAAALGAESRQTKVCKKQQKDLETFFSSRP